MSDVTSYDVTARDAADADVQAMCMWNRLEAAQCCRLEVERQLIRENNRQKQLRVAERMRRAAERIFLLIYLPYCLLTC